MRSRILFAAVLLAATSWSSARAGGEGEWQPVLGELLRAEKPGYGGLCGVVVDHETGRVWVNLSDRGLYTSESGAGRFVRCGEQPKGRTETPGCLMLDPTGRTKRLVTALVYGAPVGVSDDGGKTWRHLEAKSAHVDWCAVDWGDPGLALVLALKHEAGGLLLASRDAGRSFTEVGKGYGPGWVFDGRTAVVAELATPDRAKPGLARTADGGRTWRRVAEYSPAGRDSVQALPRWRDGTLYWLVKGGLVASRDRGATWEKLSDVKDGRMGPVFGADKGQMFVLTAAGIVESADGGKTWSAPVALPKPLAGAVGLMWLEYDPKGKFLYVMRMGSDLYRLAR